MERCRSQRGQPAWRSVRQRASASRLDSATNRGTSTQRSKAVRHQQNAPGLSRQSLLELVTDATRVPRCWYADICCVGVDGSLARCRPSHAPQGWRLYTADQGMTENGRAENGRPNLKKNRFLGLPFSVDPIGSACGYMSEVRVGELGLRHKLNAGSCLWRTVPMHSRSLTCGATLVL